MFALVANGAVNAVSKTTYTTSGGYWLPLVEDPATYSPSEEQQPAGFTVAETLVTRHWRLKPRPLTTDDLAGIQAQATALADALAIVAPTERQAELAEMLAPVGLSRTDPPETKTSK